MQGFLGGLEEPGQVDAICLLFLHQKQSLFLAYHSCSSGVSFGSLTASMSIVLESFTLGEEEKDWKVWVALLLYWVIWSAWSY